MSLRLPSQNKFKPVARPGIRKPGAPGARPGVIAQKSAPNVGASTSNTTPRAGPQKPVPASPSNSATQKPPTPKSAIPLTPSAETQESPTVPPGVADAPTPPVTAFALPAASAGRSEVPKLSLLEAAASTPSGSRPSPSSATRKTPNTPRFPRAPSVAPRARAPSVVRSRVSATPQPSSDIREPSLPPTPRTSGFPPTLSAAMQSSAPGGFPPTLASATEEPVTQQQIDHAQLAAAAVASIQSDMPPPSTEIRRRPPRRRKAPTGQAARGKKANQSLIVDDEGPDDDAASLAGSKRGASVMDEDDDGASVADSQISSRAGSVAPRSKRAKKARGPRVATISLQAIQPDEMVGSEVTDLTTMGDLATILAGEGRVTERAIKIDEFRRGQEAQKREDHHKRIEEMYQRNQIKRRKVRSANNRDRTRRREEIRNQGGNELDVSPDEMDSEEEFDVVPERLTPPASSPEPDRPEEGGQEEGEEGSDAEEVAFDNHAIPKEREPDMFDGDEGLVGTPEPEVEPVTEDADDDDALAALRAAGFTVNDEEPGSPRSDADEWDHDAVDLDEYRMRTQEQRRRDIERREDEDEVVEVDDETRFVNSATFGKNKRTQRWTKMETELFYQVLGETGENYTLMKAYFPGRDVRSLKLKGSRENKVNFDKMTQAIMSRKPIDKEYLAKAVGYDPHRAFDKEMALFEEIEADKARLKKLDSEQPIEGDIVGEGEEQEDGDQAGLDGISEGDEGEKLDENEDEQVEEGNEEDYQQYKFV
ncbi:hypothetical protein B9479_005237 [Cryptococcus floricola]|uniref:Transcription factor TFIIIB component B'' Myb domain-containing protein n=1 Tax=Cryptococcus floricola TaxID=2591691 RepID=A0A5D3AV78_9TREE|nr:hypothetical protein B9479_005237 [Cryptococcus floricola]